MATIKIIEANVRQDLSEIPPMNNGKLEVFAVIETDNQAKILLKEWGNGIGGNLFLNFEEDATGAKADNPQSVTFTRKCMPDQFGSVTFFNNFEEIGEPVNVSG